MAEAQEEIKEEKERWKREREKVLAQDKEHAKVVVDESFNSNADPDEMLQDIEAMDERPPSFHLAVSDIHDIEIKRLTMRKHIMHVVMGLCSLVVIFWYAYYYSLACGREEYYTQNP